MSRTLWDALCGIEDRRGRKGRQYELPSLLGISIAAMLAGANDLIAIFRWGRRLKPEALRLLVIDDGVAPCHATFHYFFKSLDADALAAALGKFALGAVVGDLVVEPDQNEITAAMVLLKGLPLDGAIITGDAIFCQREICRHIRDANGHYLFVVKDNQPELKSDIAETFGDLSPLATGPGDRRSAA